MSKIISYTILAGLLFLTGCSPCPGSYGYTQPPALPDGLVTAPLYENGLDTTRITEMVRQVQCGKFNEIHSLLIYRHDRLVLEEYFPGYKYQWDAPEYKGVQVQWTRDMLHPIMSSTKSIVSACVGIAIDKGFIKSIDDPIFDYLPDHQRYRSEGREHITVEHLLSMTSGLAWNEWGAAHGTSANDIDRLYFECSDDPVKCVLERTPEHLPGEYFTYNGGGVVILGEIIKNASGMDFETFSNRFLFKPLGIDKLEWYRYDNGVYATDGSLYMTPRDMLKIGILYLDKGQWRGTQIVPQPWVEKSVQVYNNNKGIKIPIEDSGKNSYGYLWWISELRHKGKKIRMYRANGWGGQVIMVFPDLDMVVTATSGNYAGSSKLFKLVKDFILPSVDAL